MINSPRKPIPSRGRRNHRPSTLAKGKGHWALDLLPMRLRHTPESPVLQAGYELKRNLIKNYKKKI